MRKNHRVNLMVCYYLNKAVGKIKKKKNPKISVDIQQRET